MRTGPPAAWEGLLIRAQAVPGAERSVQPERTAAAKLFIPGSARSIVSGLRRDTPRALMLRAPAEWGKGGRGLQKKMLRDRGDAAGNRRCRIHRVERGCEPQ